MGIATDPLSLVFIGCFLFGLLFLLGTVLSGSTGHGHGMTHGVGHHALHHMHVGGAVHHTSAINHAQAAHHGGASSAGAKGESNPSGQRFSFLAIVNPSSVVSFLLGFGFFGYVFHNEAGLGLPLTLLLSILSGCIIAALFIMLINRLIGSGETHTVQDVSDRTGLVGKVILTIQGNDPGEILYQTPGGLRKSIPARSTNGQKIERGEEVVVINFENGVAEVDTWEHFIGQEEEQEALSSSSLEDLQALDGLRALLERAGKDDDEEEYVLRKDQPMQ